MRIRIKTLEEIKKDGVKITNGVPTGWNVKMVDYYGKVFDGLKISHFLDIDFTFIDGWAFNADCYIVLGEDNENI